MLRVLALCSLAFVLACDLDWQSPSAPGRDAGRRWDQSFARSHSSTYLGHPSSRRDHGSVEGDPLADGVKNSVMSGAVAAAPGYDVIPSDFRISRSVL